jgi:hypothetical protein
LISSTPSFSFTEVAAWPRNSTAKGHKLTHDN